MFLYIPTGRLIAMSIVTLGFYSIYWNYRNWRFIKERDGLNIQPFWRGIFSYFFIYSLLKAIKNDPSTKNIAPARFSPGGDAAGWIFFMFIGNSLINAPNPTANLLGIIIAAPAVFFLLPAQSHVNAINEALPTRPPYYGWSSGHRVCILLGIIFWLFIIGRHTAGTPV